MSETFEGLEVRLQAQGFVTEVIEHEDDEGPAVYLQATPSGGHATRRIVISEAMAVDATMSEVEHYGFLRGFEGVWSRRLGVVECLVAGSFAFTLLRRFQRFVESTVDPTAIRGGTHYAVPAGADGVEVLLGPCSTELQLFAGSVAQREPSVRVTGADLTSEDDAHEVLGKLSDALFFRIDQITGISLQLRRERTLRTLPPGNGTEAGSRLTSAPLEDQYDREAMTLFWYARSASHMPLLAFLAFYQLVEYYFAAGVDREVTDTARRLIRDPRFHVSDDASVVRLVNAIRAATPGRRGASEEDQLALTIRYCVSEAEFSEWLRAAPVVEEKLKGKDAKRLAKFVVSRDDTSSDLRAQAARRLYAIRCRIVHTKDGHDEGLLLPFSPEAAALRADIAVMEFIARKALLMGAKRMAL